MKIDHILKVINLKTLLDKLGIKNLTPLDDNIMFSCPFHKDNKPSCGIHKCTGQYHCFSCGASGSIISLVTSIKELSNKEAVHYLCKIAGIKKGSLVISGKTIYRQLKKMIIGNKSKPIIDDIDKHVELPLHLNDNYFGGIQYFEGRGIHIHTLKKHGISFCTDGFYRNRAIIPIYKSDGSLLTFEARDITGVQEKKVLYPKGVKVNNTLYNLKNAKHSHEVIIVEGLMDALYLSERGFNVVSTFGASISEKQEELLSRNFRKIYLAFDGDKAGFKGMIKYGSYLSLHLLVYIITLKKNTDPDSYSYSEFLALKKQAVEIQAYISSKLFNNR